MIQECKEKLGLGDIFVYKKDYDLDKYFLSSFNKIPTLYFNSVEWKKKNNFELHKSMCMVTHKVSNSEKKT